MHSKFQALAYRMDARAGECHYVAYCVGCPVHRHYESTIRPPGDLAPYGEGSPPSHAAVTAVVG
ncbi:hypothetical protein D3C87_912620 [compost metagenome]